MIKESSKKHPEFRQESEFWVRIRNVPSEFQNNKMNSQEHKIIFQEQEKGNYPGV